MRFKGLSLLCFIASATCGDAAMVILQFEGTVNGSSSYAQGTPFRGVFSWDPAQASSMFPKGTEYDYVYYHSIGETRAAGARIALTIGTETFIYSGLLANTGRTVINLIDEPGNALDRLTFWVGDVDPSGWDLLVFEFASVSNDSLVTPAADHLSAGFDFSGDYVSSLFFHPWGGTTYLHQNFDTMTISVIPEASTCGSLGVASALMLARRRRRIFGK